MKNINSTLIALFFILTGNFALADIEAITINGKSVLLKNNNTWQYIEIKQADARYAHLYVVNKQGGDNYCRLGFKLKNGLADKITSIVFRFSAHNHEDVLYDTVTKGFLHLKPTNEGFKEVTFSGMSCEEIKYIRVHGADRCEIGELTKHSAEKGECLKLVQVEANDKFVIFKRYNDEPIEPEAPETTEAETVMESNLQKEYESWKSRQETTEAETTMESDLQKEYESWKSRQETN